MSFTIERPNGDHRNTTTPNASDFLAFLDANPGLWAVYHRYPTSNPARQKAKRLRHTHSARGYEFAVRATDGQHTLYGRRVAPTHTQC